MRVVQGFRRFYLQRHEDPTGVSGVGHVAEGVQFSDGSCVLNWLTQTSSTGLYDSIADIVEIHGHGGATTVQWIDPELPLARNDFVDRSILADRETA